MRLLGPLLIVASLWLFVPTLPTHAQQEERPEPEREEEPKDPREQEERSDEVAELPIFTPQERPAPRARVGAATRGAQTAQAPGIQALVPDRVGLTLEGRPTLYWYTPERFEGRGRLVLSELRELEPALEQELSGPFAPGVQRLSLAKLGAELRPGVTYQWFLTLVPDGEDRSQARTIGGGIERIDASPDLRARLAAASAARRPFILARDGIWYDALDSLSRRIDASPSDASSKRQRAALIDQVDLPEVAAADRAAAAD